MIVITVWFISKLDVKRPVYAAAGGVSTSDITVHGPATEGADARTRQDKWAETGYVSSALMYGIAFLSCVNNSY